MHIRKPRLLAPGPTPLYPPAVHAMAASDLHHRTPEFRALYREVLASLKRVFGVDRPVLPLVASGTGGMEAAVANCFSPGDPVIVATAGKFGERWVGLARAFGLAAHVVEKPYGAVITAADIAEALRAQPAARGVFLQASESSTGVAHDVAGVARILRDTEALLVIDAITGLGTMPLEIDAWGLDVVIGGSQKAFMIPPGLAFVTLTDKAWARVEEARSPRFYFDLRKERAAAESGDPSWTPSVALVLALAEALKYIERLGMAKLIENAQLLARATREAALALGLPLFAQGSPAGSVTSVCPPPGLDSGVIVKELKAKFGATITNGQGSMQGKLFRVAHLGYFDFPDLWALLAALELVLEAQGHGVELGSGVAAAQRVYRAAVSK
jgi:aspartate aminotransferase-like enzyme